MKNIVFVFWAVFLVAQSAPLPAAANNPVKWWLMPTVCKPSSSSCYGASVGAGFVLDEWDDMANCRGKKLACPNAIVGGASGPTAMSKSELSDPAVVSEDFDITALYNPDGRPADACFGLRRTRNNGTSAKVGSEWRHVWCKGVLDFPDEDVATGEIALAAKDQPTCRDLADSGRIGILNGQCYGSEARYFPNDYYLECSEGELLPSRIVNLNGAKEPRIGNGSNVVASSYPTTDEMADAMFEKMIANAADQRREHAGDDAE